MEEFVARVQKVVFHNADNGYTICRIKADDHKLSAKGYFDVKEHQTYYFCGELDEDPTYGEFLKVMSVKAYVDESENGVINYLSSDIFTGVGKSSARKIYRHFGEKCIELLKQDPELIEDVDGLAPRVKEEIKRTIQSDDLQNSIMQLLKDFNLTPLMLNRIYQKVRNWADPVVDLKNNPYRLLDFYSDEKISFNLADELYCTWHEDHYSYLRLSNILTNLIVELCFKNGDSLVQSQALINACSKKYGIVVELVEQTLVDMERENIITRFDDDVQLTTFCQTENYIAEQLKLRLQYLNYPIKPDMHQLCAEFSAQEQITLATKQQEALQMALNYPVSIITGGPGTGKTTIINGIVYCLTNYFYPDLTQDQLADKIALVAPTGRASFRMMESTNYSAKTIHSLLGMHQTSHQARYNQENPLPHKYIIIDEFSMVDMFLFKSLLEALSSDCRIIMVGDKNQLESVGPGSLLRDMIASEKIPITMLNEIYRQGEGSSISKLAQAIKQEQPIISGNDQEVSIIDLKTNLVNNIKKVVDKSLASGFDIMQTQVLYTRYQGEVGIDHINEQLHHPHGETVVNYRNHKFYVGDKIMVLKNNYDYDIYNGDIGIISKIFDPNAKNNELCLQIIIRNRSIDLSYKELELLTHAYCISVHKSQGSEFDVVIFPIHDNFMLTKKVIYTAITRASKKLIVIGDLNKLNHGVKANDYHRSTRLQQLLERDV